MKSSTLLAPLAVLAGFLLAPKTLHAQEQRGFGSQTQLILSADRLVPVLSYSRRSQTAVGNNGVEVTNATNNTSSSLLWGGNLGPDFVHTIPRVGADVAIGKSHLTLGGSFVFAFTLSGSRTTEAIAPNGARVETEVDSPSSTVLGFVPRIGYILPLSDVVGFWFRGGFAIYSLRTKDYPNPNEYNVDKNTVFSLDLDPQLTIVPVEHFFIGVGPLLNIPVGGSYTREEARPGRPITEFSVDQRVFQLGVTAALGGWFDL